MIAVTWI